MVAIMASQLGASLSMDTAPGASFIITLPDSLTVGESPES
jgi:hypothetical protein